MANTRKYSKKILTVILALVLSLSTMQLVFATQNSEPALPLIDFDPVVSVTKSADKNVYDIGETISWTITVTNTSNYVAYNVVIHDDLVGLSGAIRMLSPGETIEYHPTSVAEESGILTNSVDISWDDNDLVDDSAEPDEVKTGTAAATVTVAYPVSVEPPVVSSGEPVAPSGSGEVIDILDEEVPLAAVPQTGDLSAVLLTLSAVSGSGLVLAGLRRKKDTEA